MKLLVLLAAAAAVVSLCVGLPADPQPRKFIYQVGSPSVRRYPVYPDRLLQPSPAFTYAADKQRDDANSPCDSDHQADDPYTSSVAKILGRGDVLGYDQLKMAMEAARLSTQTKEHQRFRPNMLMPEMKKPEMLQPETAMPELLQPWTLRPEVMEPETMRPMVWPETTRPEVMQPVTTRPEVMQPVTTRPEVMQPVTTRPEVMQPVTTRPEVMQPVTTRPELVEPETTRPEVVEPETTRPEVMIQPETATPEMIQPMTTRPDMMEAEGEMASVPLTDPPTSLDDFDELDPFINQSSVAAAPAAAAPAEPSAPEEMLLTQMVTERDMVTDTMAEETEEGEVGMWLTTLSPFDETGETHRLADSPDEMRDTFQPFADTTFDDQNLTEAIEEETATEYLYFTDIDAL